ncbi:MAG: hypothetical protein M1476_01300 [Candidatus Thermoplasmatota archaeon]|nr:hypothetical protein [Candidatus Thermoplasmatota archaeon]
MNKRIIFSIIALATILFAGSAFAASTPQTYVPGIYEPNPSMNGNITWSTFNSSWAWNEYNNSSGNQYLSANLSSFYANPVNVNPANIMAPGLLQNDKVGSNYWNNTGTGKGWTLTVGGVGVIGNLYNNTINGEPQISLTSNSTAAGTSNSYAILNIPFATLPATNPAYDYITITGYVSLTHSVTGAEAYIDLENSTGALFGTRTANNGMLSTTSGGPTQYLYPGQSFYVSAPLTSWTKNGFNPTNTSNVEIHINEYFPQTTTAAILNTTITGLSMTQSALYLGTSIYNNSKETRNIFWGVSAANLTSFNPSSSLKVINGGYSAAVSQKMSDLTNVTVSQAAISSGNYVEQVTYGASFSLPAAPDLTYGNFNLTQSMNVPGSQFIALDVNGVSYSSQVSNLTSNKTFGFGVVNPQDPNYFAVVDYTESQWNSISSSPGIFTIAGIEYYYWLAVGALIGVLGIGAGAKHSANVRAEQLRGRK